MSYIVPAQDIHGWFLYIQLERDTKGNFVRESWIPSTDREWSYIRGETQPNYPMPAIPLKVDWRRTYMTIDELNKYPELKCVLFRQS